MTKLQDLRDAVWMHGPEHFDMSSWYNVHGQNASVINDIDKCDRIDIRDCGTTACLAGHGAIVALKKYDTKMNYPSNVAEFFGLPYNLFFTSGWDALQFEDGTLSDHFVALYVEGADHPDWQAAIDYLDLLVKKEANAQ